MSPDEDGNPLIEGEFYWIKYPGIGVNEWQPARFIEAPPHGVFRSWRMIGLEYPSVDHGGVIVGKRIPKP